MPGQGKAHKERGPPADAGEPVEVRRALELLSLRSLWVLACRTQTTDPASAGSKKEARSRMRYFFAVLVLAICCSALADSRGTVIDLTAKTTYTVTTTTQIVVASPLDGVYWVCRPGVASYGIRRVVLVCVGQSYVRMVGIQLCDGRVWINGWTVDVDESGWVR